MGMCHSLRARLIGAHPSIAYGGEGEPHAGALEHADPQLIHRLRQELIAKEKADKKRSKSIDKTLKAEKRAYKQTHRLLLLGCPQLFHLLQTPRTGKLLDIHIFWIIEQCTWQCITPETDTDRSSTPGKRHHSEGQGKLVVKIPQ